MIELTEEMMIAGSVCHALELGSDRLMFNPNIDCGEPNEEPK